MGPALRCAVLASLAALGGCEAIVGIDDYKSALSALEPSVGTLQPAFDPAVSTYDLDVGFGVTDVSFTPTTDDQTARIEVASAAVASGTASSAIAVPIGLQEVDIDVTNDNVTLTYQVFVHRGEGLEQDLFAKSGITVADDRFGQAIALSDDTLAVGSPNDNNQGGGVYIFRLAGATWIAEAHVVAPQPDPLDGFGSAVALEGDVLVVGAPGESSNATGVGGDQLNDTAAGSGAAYVFHRTGSTWSFEAYLKASNTGAGDAFGTAVAIAASTVVVGAPLEDSTAAGIDGDGVNDGAGSAGAVYVFNKVGSSWSQQAYAKASNTGAGDRFGDAVAIDGNVVAVGAPFEDSGNGTESDNGASEAGAVYVLVRSGVAWSQEKYIKAAQPAAIQFLGFSVAVHGDIVAAGVPGRGGDKGGVSIFQRDGGDWTDVFDFEAETSSSANLGNSVAMSEVDGDVYVAAGAHTADALVGRVFYFAPTPAGSERPWDAAGSDVPVASDREDLFGTAVAASGPRIAAGAPGEDTSGVDVDPTPDELTTDSGAAYVFE